MSTACDSIECCSRMKLQRKKHDFSPIDSCMGLMVIKIRIKLIEHLQDETNMKYDKHGNYPLKAHLFRIQNIV